MSFQSVEKHDIVIGVVSSVMDSGLVITLLCLDNGKSRDIDQLRISAFCPVKELPKLFPNQDAIEGFQVRDKVRAVVLSVNPETEKLIVSMVERSLPEHHSDVKLALINEDEFPVQYRRKLHIRGLTFDELLHSILGFNNSGNIGIMLETLDQEETLSGGNNYMDLSDMPLDKNQQTMMWQQNQYMDSGIQSGATTNAPSISSKGNHHEPEDKKRIRGDNMDTTRMMLDWAEQNYSNPQYTQDQVDGRFGRVET
ncbi:unnamed protein product [Mytilus edulis]|uniref:S1 motif domain-containing protein n=1 Tax=Mytilus edulis TaxID=6550 RepID=A0A8S3SFJ6_MYTED|nr:unnamed protein product [Mytilus edulis]